MDDDGHGDANRRLVIAAVGNGQTAFRMRPFAVIRRIIAEESVVAWGTAHELLWPRGGLAIAAYGEQASGAVRRWKHRAFRAAER